MPAAHSLIHKECPCWGVTWACQPKKMMILSIIQVRSQPNERVCRNAPQQIRYPSSIWIILFHNSKLSLVIWQLRSFDFFKVLHRKNSIQILASEIGWSWNFLSLCRFFAHSSLSHRSGHQASKNETWVTENLKFMILQIKLLMVSGCSATVQWCSLTIQWMVMFRGRLLQNLWPDSKCSTGKTVEVGCSC